MAEKSSWDKANRRQKTWFGLEKQKENWTNYHRLLLVTFFLLIILWDTPHALTQSFEFERTASRLWFLSQTDSFGPCLSNFNKYFSRNKRGDIYTFSSFPVLNDKSTSNAIDIFADLFFSYKCKYISSLLVREIWGDCNHSGASTYFIIITDSTPKI